MCRLIVSLLLCSFFILTLEIYQPRPDPCLRKGGGVWWEHYGDEFEKKCELDSADGEECGVCGRSCFTCKRKTTVYPACWHKGMGWKFDIIKPEGSSVQICSTMDHCSMSYLLTDESQFRKMCGNDNAGGEQRGVCKSVYGTYVCECKKPYQGRDCNDEGPEGSYATGVQVLLDTKIRIAQMITLLIAVKSSGTDFKVHVNTLHYQTTITITKPLIHDPSSEKLIKHCELKTRLKKQCATHLRGSTAIYSVSVRFPLVRDFSVWYYQLYPIGYNTTFIVTTTNTVNGVEKESFFRTQYDRGYIVFVEYPIVVGCYKNVRISNCKSIQENVKTYRASSEIVVTGELFVVTDFNEPPDQANVDCGSSDDDLIKWELWQVRQDGSFLSIDDEYHADNPFEYVIKPYALKNGMHSIVFSYTTSTGDDIRENFDQCFFTVVEEPLVATIEGGRSRYVDVDTVITLDGSGSYDPNVNIENNTVGLHFQWSCIINQTKEKCLEAYLPTIGSHSYVKLPVSVLESKKQYIITLVVTKEGKKTAYATQTLVAGSKGKVQAISIQCINCMEGNVANPEDYIYLLVEIALRVRENIDSPVNYIWTFSNYPDYPPNIPTESFRVNKTSHFLLKVDRDKLKENKVYSFRVQIEEDKNIFADIDIRIPLSKNFTCSVTPETGIAAVTDFVLSCSSDSSLTYEIYDKSSNDPDYFSGRMLFTAYNPSNYNFKLANKRLVVYGYNRYKMIDAWVYDMILTPFDGQLKDIDDMVSKLEDIRGYSQKLLNSVSVIPGALKPDMNWSSISLLKNLVSFVDEFKLKSMREIKLVLSSIQFILAVLSELEPKIEFKIEVEEAKMCADIISSLASALFERVKLFDAQRTLTETILQQMIISHLNVIQTILNIKTSEVLSKPLHLVNPYVLHLVKDTTYELVNALYKLSSCLLWRQIQGDSATETVSLGSKISQWVMVNKPHVLYHLRRQNQSVPFNFSFGFYKSMKNLDVFGIQVTNLIVNPFWWAGGDITTNILLIDLCFKVDPLECRYQRTFYKDPILLYFNISQTYNSLKPLEIYTVYLNLSQNPRSIDSDITVYRFDPPPRSKLFIEFEFENTDEDYKVLFSVNERPDLDKINKKGVTVNNKNQSSVKYLKYIKDNSDKLYYMGIFPVSKGVAGVKCKFNLSIVYAVCKTWLRWKWGSERCWVGEQETDESTLRCDCNHLSMFAGTVQVPPYTLNPAMEFLLFLTEEFNWLPLVVLIIVIVVFIMLSIWGSLKDRKDKLKGIVTVLEDNYPGESFAYLVGVFTGSRISSSTHANVGIKLFGDEGETRTHILKNSYRPVLRGNSDDWFLIYCPENLGILTELYIWHDNSGKNPDWFVEKIEVYDLSERLKYIFELNVWLALGVNEYPEVIAATSSMADLCSVRRAFLGNVVTGFRDTNYWTSICWKHARNPVQRVQRISVVLCYVMVAMLVSVFVYQFNKGEEYEEDDPVYRLDLTDFIIFTITFLVAYFIACFVMFFFRKSYSHRHITHTQSSLFLRPEDMNELSLAFSSKRSNYRPRTDIKKHLEKLSTVSLYDKKTMYIELSITNLNDKFIRLGARRKKPSERTMYENFAVAVHAIVRGSSLNSVTLPNSKNNVVLHKKYCFPAWILVTVTIPASAVFVLLFGHRIPLVESKKWLTTFLCTLVFDALVLSTLKILLCSAILACLFQRVVPESNYQIKAEDGMNKELYGNKKYLKKLAQIRNDPMYFPLTENLRTRYRQNCIRREHTRTLIDFLVILLLIFVLVMLNAVYTVNYYRSNSHAVWMLTRGPSYKYQDFTNIYNRTLYTEFIFYNFIERMHRYIWYNDEGPLNDNDDIMRRKSWAYDCTMRLLGNVRIRQLRVVLGECSLVNHFTDIEDYCSPPWSSGVEDTGSYGSRWRTGRNEPLIRKVSGWRYTDAAHSNCSVSYGPTLTTYPSGGFIDDLGFEEDDIEDSLSSLFPQNWLDHMTRAVFVDLTLYNVNTRLFSQVILVAEQMPTGEYLVAVKTESVSTNFSFDIWKISFVVFFIFFSVRMCVLINRRGLFVYFSKMINVYEMFLLALGFFTFLFYILHINLSSEYVQEFQRRGKDEFFDFFHIFYYSQKSRTALCILFACLIVRMFISLRFGRIFFTFYYTFHLSFPWIVWLVLYFILYLVVIQRFIGFLLSLYIFPCSTTVMLYPMDFSVISGSEQQSYRVLLYVMCLTSYIVILLFIASFAHYYKVAKIYRLIETDKLNFFVLLIEIVKSRCKNKSVKTYVNGIIENTC